MKAIVTGASSGIGQGIAIVLARHGCDVAITYSGNEQGALETREKIEALGQKCFVYKVSLQKHDTLQAFVDEATSALDGLDLMMLNAGKDIRYSILGVTAEELHGLIDINLIGNYLLAGAAARYMARNGVRGTILFTTSTRGESAHFDDFLYGSTKAALSRACKSMAVELAPYGIRVNCIAPGATRVRPNRVPDNFKDGDLLGGAPWYRLETSVPAGRLGTPEENGELAYFLASDAASYITGETIKVDGALSDYGPPEGFAAGHWISPAWLEKQKAFLEQ